MTLPIVVLDFETFFSKDFTLKKLTTENYVRDPRFRVHGAAVKPPGGTTNWWSWDQLPIILAGIDWANTACLCHHAHFDGLILAHHYNVRPKMWLDTMPMGRLLLGNHVSVALGSLAEIFGLAAKSVPYERMKGFTWEGMDAGLRRDVAQGAIHDVDLTWDIFCRMAEAFPAEEYALVDAAVRMFTEPRLVGNTTRLSEIYSHEQERKAGLLRALGVTGEALRSKEHFAALLRELGIDIATREEARAFIEIDVIAQGWKKTNAGVDYAFAKSDDFMRDLLEDGDERVSALAEARLAHTSSIVSTRASRLCEMSKRGRMCVYLAPFAAHTTRFGGGDKLNWQNFPRNSDLGTGIEARSGEMIVVADASQIECRLLNTIAGQDDVVDKFRRKEDPYIENASKFYGHPVYKPKEGDPRYDEMLCKRGFGKQLELQCGFGAGGPSIVATAKRGSYGPPVFLTEAEGMQARDLYRAGHPLVCDMWHDADHLLGAIERSLNIAGCWWDVLTVHKKRIYLPNDAPLIYDTLEWFEGEGKKDWRRGFRFRTKKGWQKIYGAMLVENVIQALSRVHTSQAWLRCQRAGIRMVSMEHDKLIAVVKESQADAALAVMQREMCAPPEWLPGIPLDSEGYISRTLKK